MMIEHVLACFAHPDDETIMVGGTLAMLAAHGVTTHLASATRGEGGEAGDPPVVTDRRELGTVREGELRCAANALGATTLDFLGYIDPDIGPEDTLGPFEANWTALLDQIGALIRQYAADVVLTHGPDGEYGHPAHQLMHRAVVAAVEQHAPNTLLYSVMAQPPAGTVSNDSDRLWNKSRPAHLLLDTTPWAGAKLAAMDCHTSQHALFKRRRKLQHVHEALRVVETFHREWPPIEDAPRDDAFSMLMLDAGATY